MAAPSNIDAVVNDQEMTNNVDSGDKFAPSRSEEGMRERAEQLKRKVREVFHASTDAMSVAELVTYVDTLERLGIDNHFHDVIDAALNRILSDEPVGSDVFSNSLHIVALRFRLLRQHGIWVSADVFNQFRDEIGSFSTSICSDRRGLLSLYNAAHMAVPGEVTLDDAIIFAKGHLKAIKGNIRWWRDLYDTVKLPYARDRMVEIYFWPCGILHEEEYSHSRMLFAKTFGMTSLLDDTFDVHATFEECHKLNEAMQRRDESAVLILPEYLRKLYIEILRNFKEFEDSLEPNKKYLMSYMKNAYKLQSQNYLREQIWSSQKYQPSFKEHEELSSISAGLPMLTIVTLLGYGTATQEMFEWVSSVPKMVRAGSHVTRLLNDLASFKVGKHKKDMPSAVETYMIENGLVAEEAVQAIATLLENRWRVLNQENMYIASTLLPAAQTVVNMVRPKEVIYLHGRDAYTFGDDLKDLVTRLFLREVPL